MKLFYKYLLFLLFFPNINAETFIRVLLEKSTQDEPTIWYFDSVNKFEIQVKNNRAVNRNFKNLKVEIINNKIYLNGKLYKFDQIKLIASKEAPIAINSNLYAGNFIICRYKDAVLLINQVELEDYIFSVLKTESWPGWPIEVNKAFAIASRSYVLAQVLISRKSKLPYDIKNTNYHQTYSGIHYEDSIKTATNETKGIILGHNKQPILAMFDSCCGGIIPAHIEGFDFQNHPYLAREERCDHCKKVKMFSWKASFSKQDFKKAILKKTPGLVNIKNITTKTDKAGTVKHLTVHDHETSYLIDARTMYSMFKDIKSFSYCINQDGNKITLKGFGFGHHLGLCQWGAREMIKKGYNHREILRFYYPNTKFMKFKDIRDN